MLWRRRLGGVESVHPCHEIYAMNKDSRDALLGIASLVGFMAFVLGTLGQAGLAGEALRPHLPGRIAVFGVFLVAPPCLAVFMIVVFRVPMLAPRPFRQCLTVAMCWMAAMTIILEAMFLLGYMPPDSPKFAGTILRTVMHIGWLGFIPLISVCALARRYERIWDRRARRAASRREPNPNTPPE